MTVPVEADRPPGGGGGAVDEEPARGLLLVDVIESKKPRTRREKAWVVLGGKFGMEVGGVGVLDMLKFHRK